MTPPRLPAFDHVVGQARAVAILQAALARPRHAYLLVGPPNVGKTTLATAWSQALFCRERAGCGRCAECRSFLHGNYADFHLWEPAGRSTSIEQIRDLVRQAELAPYRGTHQVHVLFPDTMSLAAANCLLKTLEEPSEGTVLLLLAGSVADVLPTIVSRCQRVPLELVGSQAIEEWLVARHDADRGLAVIAARRAAGRIGHALELLGRDDAEPGLLAMTDPLEALAEADRVAATPLEGQIQALEDLQLLVRDALLLCQTGREDWVGQPAEARQLGGSGRPFATWLRILHLLADARERLQAGASPRLTWSVIAHRIVTA